MKQLLIGLIIFAFMNTVYAGDAVNLYLRISGTAPDNRYFFCEPGMGCLSILAAERGKVYRILRPIQFQNVYLSNLQTFRVTGQPLPASCRVKVTEGHSITVYGQIRQGPKNSVYLTGLHCSVR